MTDQQREVRAEGVAEQVREEHSALVEAVGWMLSVSANQPGYAGARDRVKREFLALTAKAPADDREGE